MHVNEILKKFIEIYEALGDNYKAAAFSKALHSSSTKGLGCRSSTHISRIIEEAEKTGESKELNKLLADPKIRAALELTQVMGIGPSSAKTLIDTHKIYTLAQLRRAFITNKINLTTLQKLGLAHFSDLQKRIPRAEVEQIHDDIMSVINPNKNIKSEILGSYRRGAPTCGDVDILITPTTTTPINMQKIIKLIEECPYTVATIAKGTQKIALLFSSRSSIVRRVDIFYATKSQYIPYLLYGTGSAEHNEYMRALAKKHGYKLNQLSLERLSDGTRKILRSERDLYALLGIPYVEPDRR